MAAVLVAPSAGNAASLTVKKTGPGASVSTVQIRYYLGPEIIKEVCGPGCLEKTISPAGGGSFWIDNITANEDGSDPQNTVSWKPADACISPNSRPSSCLVDWSPANGEDKTVEVELAAYGSDLKDALIVTEATLGALCPSGSAQAAPPNNPCVEEVRPGGKESPDLSTNIYTYSGSFTNQITVRDPRTGETLKWPYRLDNVYVFGAGAGLAGPGGGTLAAELIPLKEIPQFNWFVGKPMEEIGDTPLYLKIKAPSASAIGTAGASGRVSYFKTAESGQSAELVSTATAYWWSSAVAEACKFADLMQRTYLDDQTRCAFDDDKTAADIGAGYRIGTGPSLGRVVFNGSSITGVEPFESAKGTVIETDAQVYTLPLVIPNVNGIRVGLAAASKRAIFPTTPLAPTTFEQNKASYRVWLPAAYSTEAFGLSPSQLSPGNLTATKLSGTTSSTIPPTVKPSVRDGREGVEIAVDGVTFSAPKLTIARRGAKSVKAKVKAKFRAKTIFVEARYGKPASGRPATLGFKKGRTYRALRTSKVRRDGRVRFTIRRTRATKRLGVWLTTQGPQSATSIKARR